MFRDVVISIMVTLAAQERITISERIKAGLARTRKAGTKLGRPSAQIDLDLVRQRQEKGDSLRSIAKTLKVSHVLLVKRLKSELTAGV